MEKPIFLVGGGKGGVGKSLLSIALVDYVDATDGRPFLVETDTSVPDVYKTYRRRDRRRAGEPRRARGMDRAAEPGREPGRRDTIVINTGARNQTGISNFGKTLRKALPQLKRKLVVFWLIDRKRESLELLSDFIETLPEAEINVVRNMYLGHRAEVRAVQRIEDARVDRADRRPVTELPRAGGSGDRRHEQGTVDGREGDRGAVLRRSDGDRSDGGTSARRCSPR